MSGATVNYLEKYFECMDSLPQELQRHISHLREVDFRTRGFVSKLSAASEGLSCALKGGQITQQRRALHQLTTLSVFFREAGDDKSEITAQMLDTIEDHHQQLQLRAKDLESPRTHGDTINHNAMRHSTALPVEIGVQSKRASQSYKRPRPPEKGSEDDLVKEFSHSSVTVGANKSNKKKMKMNKKSSNRSGKESSFVPAPMPDLSSAPIDPNEPTYCLCRQVSFGEMIGCDNEECPIEWFHFQCVGLTSKPKGRWYCPACCQERRTKLK